VIVADQSADEATADIAAYGDTRVRYVHCSIAGKTRALNVALAAADGEIVALTDDDCVVEPDWLERAMAPFLADTNLGVVFGPLAPAPHDPAEAFIPRFLPTTRRRLSGRPASIYSTGVVGANMTLRRSAADSVGGWDECIGPGSRFRSGDDVDFGYRVLAAGFAVLIDTVNPVFHFGARRYADGSVRQLLRNNYYGLGAQTVKQLRCGDVRTAWPLARLAVGEGLRLLGEVVAHRRLTGGGRLMSLVQGALAASRHPIDREHRRFIASAASSTTRPSVPSAG
jgi:glycosyltransferase involved in cell wall biosynthesis